MWIVVLGNPATVIPGGIRYIGPFEEFDEASGYLAARGFDGTVIQLSPPD
jgi:hypothetical protein